MTGRRADTRRRARLRRIRLENGLVVVARENRSAPSVAVRLVLRAGTAFESDGKAGTAALVASLFDRGAGGMSAEAIADGFDFLGASYRSRARADALVLDARLLSQHLPDILGYLRLLVSEPTFPDREFRRERDSQLTAIAEHAQDTSAVAAEALDAALYPAGHAYHSPALGSRESVSQITREDLVRFHRDHCTPAGAVLLLAGDIDPARAIDMATEVFGSWKVAGARLDGEGSLPIPDPPPPEGETIIIKPIAGKTQADLALAFVPSIRRLSPDLQAALVLSSVLGEFSLGGRLGTEIRERAGLAYYVFSYVRAGLGPGPFVVRAGVAPGQVRRAVGLMRRTIRGMVEHGVRPAELKDSKQALASAVPRLLETNAGAAALLADCEFHGLGVDHPDRVPALIAAVDRAAVNEAARRHLTLGRQVLVVAGPRLNEKSLR